MVANPHRIEFRTFEDMATHLDRWAARSLVDTTGWNDSLLTTQDWLDYSSRNQVLLASYDVDGPVAGVETWRLVASTSGRGCAVRAGEHGYPIRVPVTTPGREPDPYLGGVRPTRAAVERWEWRPVYSIDQLARLPVPAMLPAATIPDCFTGPDADREYLAAVRRVASSTVRGRLPTQDDPHAVLSDAATRLTRSGKRTALDPILAHQTAWLVGHRVGHHQGDLPAFDPAPLEARERWQHLQAVLEPARKLTAALGATVGVDLLGSSLPRMTIDDDRVVPATRRHRLPRASFEQLPVGRWVEVGPYTEQEWAARGETASGRGAYLRLNQSAYVVAVEHGDTAGWRVEDIAERTGHGHLASGTDRCLEDAQTNALNVLQGRYPALAPASEGVVSRFATGWEALPGPGRSRAEMRRVSDEVTIYALAGPGGRWIPALQRHTAGTLERLASTRTLPEARDAAELAGRRVVRDRGISSPAQFDDIVAALATSGDYDRRELADLVGRRLDPDEHTRVRDTDDPAELVELLGAAGVTPATTVLVLAADGTDAHAAATVLPLAGVPMSDGIRALAAHWTLDRTDAATLLDATASEMRDAGCDASEILRVRPREVLRTLSDDPRVWELAAATMHTSGHPLPTVVRHLIAHAPSPEAFSAGLSVVVDDPRTGLALACHQGAPGDLLADLSERYGLSPEQTAVALGDANATPQVLVETLVQRCEGDPQLTTALATSVCGLTPDTVAAHLDQRPAHAVVPSGGVSDGHLAERRPMSLDEESNAALLAALPPAGASAHDHTDTLALPEPTRPESPALVEVSR